jgi:hypothetical protein
MLNDHRVVDPSGGPQTLLILSFLVVSLVVVCVVVVSFVVVSLVVMTFLLMSLVVVCVVVMAFVVVSFVVMVVVDMALALELTSVLLAVDGHLQPSAGKFLVTQEIAKGGIDDGKSRSSPLGVCRARHRLQGVLDELALLFYVHRNLTQGNGSRLSCCRVEQMDGHHARLLIEH